MAVSSRSATATLPTYEQILITREFDAPRHFVWKAPDDAGARAPLLAREPR